MSYNSDEFAGYLFGVFDKNRVGSVDLKEFMCALSRASRGSLEDKIKCIQRSASRVCLSD